MYQGGGVVKIVIYIFTLNIHILTIIIMMVIISIIRIIIIIIMFHDITLYKLKDVLKIAVKWLFESIGIPSQIKYVL